MSGTRLNWERASRQQLREPKRKPPISSTVQERPPTPKQDALVTTSSSQPNQAQTGPLSLVTAADILCPCCEGTGWYHPCELCDGEGRITPERNQLPLPRPRA